MHDANGVPNQPQIARGLLAISFVAFISLGLPDGLLGVAWPGISRSFSLPVDALGLVLVFGTGGYMLSSFLSGPLVKRIGIGRLLGLSCAATAGALLVYATTPVWWLFVLAASLGGLGAGAIDAGINTFIATYFGAGTMQWLHASFGVGITSGPFIMTLGIALTSTWRTGYRVVAVAQAVLAVIFLLLQGRWQGIRNPDGEAHLPQPDAPLLATLKHLPALLSMLMFFLYTGIEIGLGLWAYSLLTQSRGVSPEMAGVITGSYWGMFTVGRILAGWYARAVNARRLISLSIVLALVGVGLLLVNAGQVVTVLGVALAGFAVAPIFPGLVSDTGDRVGARHQANTIGIQIAAAGFGAAVVPSLAGVLARIYGLEVIPLYLAVALGLLLACFALSHVRVRQASPAGGSSPARPER